MLVLGTTMIITTVFYLTPFTTSFPTSFSKPGGPLNDFIKHYEAAFYDSERIAFEHRRLRRAAAALNKSVAMYPLKITISTRHRVFKLLLQADDSLFAENAVFEGEDGKPIQFDSRKAYVGTLENDETAKVRGILTKDGLFDGTVSTGHEEYYIEPVSRYQNASTPTTDKGDSDFGYHTIVYKTSDVLHPNSGSLCASARLHRSRSSALDDGDQNSRAFRRKRRGTRSTRVPAAAATNEKESSLATGSDSNVLYDLDFSGNSYFLKNSSGVRRKGKSGIGIGSSTVTASPDKPSAASNPEYNMYHNVDKVMYLPAEQYYSKRNIAVDPKKTTCMLYLQADHLFFEKYGTEETCIEVMTRHVQRVNSIYRNTDFNQDGKPDNISFMIKRIKVHSLKDPSYRFPGNYGVEKFLELFSEEDYDAFCLAYMFTYRDFEMGTLGLAWTGDLRNAGGVCEKNGHYRGSLKSLNTGIVTVLNYGKHVPSAVSHVTLAHEIGHNFGSPHDPEGCTPGGEDGNFIMFARATSGDKKNNNKFSPCSLSAIDPVLNVKARSSRGCFTTPQRSICGNGVVEPGEECDCGWEEDCKDTCCFPQRRYASPDEPPCRLTPNAVCSPSQGPCCTAECKIKYGDLCRTDNGCRDASYCDGKNPICPPSINKPNKTVCNEEFVCYMGECTGSICLAYGLESCQCIPTPSDAPTKACELCCKLPGENQPCLSSFLWNTAPYDVPDMFSKPGTPCNDYNGYCDVFRRCREVDPSGPLATLRKLLLSEENIASFKKWAIDHWYYTASIVMTFILIVVLSTKYLGKNPKMKSVTVMHKAPTEIVRLPTDNSAAVVVHPVAVRSKLPLKKKVRESSNRHLAENANSNSNNNGNGNSNNNNNNNNNNAKAGGAGVAERGNGRSAAKPVKCPGTAAAAVAACNNYHRDSEAAKKHRRKQAKSKNCDNLVLYSTKINVEEDPIGKVRNWLINSQNAACHLNSSLRKSKSTPTLSSNSAEVGERTEQDVNRNAAAAPSKPISDRKSKCALTKDGTGAGSPQQMRLQVLYKPPFKFSLKLRKNRPTPEVSSQLVKDNGAGSNLIGAAVRRLSEVNKQKPVQPPLRIDRIRPPMTTTTTTTKAPNDIIGNKNDAGKTAIVGNGAKNDPSDTVAHRNDGGAKVAVVNAAKHDGNGKTAPVNNGRSSKANAHKKRKPNGKEDVAKSTHDPNRSQNNPTKTEFRRSQSAPQPSEPIYENTASCQLPNSSSLANTLPRNDRCEPHYANLGSSSSAHVTNDNFAADKLPFIVSNASSSINAYKLAVYDRRMSKRRHNNSSSSNNNNNNNNNNNSSSSSSNRHLQRSSSALASTKQTGSSQQRNRSTVTDRSGKRHSLQHNSPSLPLSSGIRLSQRRDITEPSTQPDNKNASTTAEKQHGAGSNLCATDAAPHTIPSDLEVLVSDNENSVATPS